LGSVDVDVPSVTTVVLMMPLVLTEAMLVPTVTELLVV
jgi:hypothetical protein